MGLQDQKKKQLNCGIKKDMTAIRLHGPRCSHFGGYCSNATNAYFQDNYEAA